MTNSKIQVAKTTGDCSQCGRKKRAKVLAKEDRSFSDGDVSAWETHYLLECGGCGKIYYQSVYSDSESFDNDEHGNLVASEMVVNWPGTARREVPEWMGDLLFVDTDLMRIMEEIYGAINKELRIVAAIAMRTAIDRAAVLLKIDEDVSFKEKVKKLIEGGHIGLSEKEHIETMIEAGHAAAHRGWMPTYRQLDVLLDSLDGFIYRNFLSSDRLKEVKRKIPERAQRKK